MAYQGSKSGDGWVLLGWIVLHPSTAVKNLGSFLSGLWFRVGVWVALRLRCIGFSDLGHPYQERERERERETQQLVQSLQGSGQKLSKGLNSIAARGFRTVDLPSRLPGLK